MIDGKLLRDAMLSGANHINNKRREVDALNVFPVPDGDTGTNMGMTISAAKRELERMPDSSTVGDVANTAASALLRGARGNSGVILSLLFRGFSRGLAGKTTAQPADFAQALTLGVEAAYKAVMKPTEGTMLTVARLAAERARTLARQATLSLEELWSGVVDEAMTTLANTPELLPVLKKAGVVDAGGQGLVYIFEGMQRVFNGQGMVRPLSAQEQPAEDQAQPIAATAAGDFEDWDERFPYCTEFLILKQDKHCDIKGLQAYLESIGDSIVVVDDDEIIKCHVHTYDPGTALSRALKLGQLTSMKIENMMEQHEAQKRTAEMQKQTFAYVPVDPDRNYGFVAVAAGEGVRQLFGDLGADNVVSGGQTMNPSTDDILSAIHATPAKTVFVLPNNKNIIMAAEQTIKLTDRSVHVLPTRTIPQGLSAMLAFDPEAGVEENLLAMGKAADRVGTGQITFAARDSNFDGHNIKAGELLGLENGKLAFTESDLTKAAMRLTKSLLKRDSSFITIIYGEDVTTEQAEQIEQAIREKVAPADAEVTLVAGGQPVYYLIVSVE